MAKKTKSETRSQVEKIAREAGKVAARAERVAKGAVDKAVSASSTVVDYIAHPTQLVGAIGGAVSSGQEKIGDLADTATGLVQVREFIPTVIDVNSRKAQFQVSHFSGYMLSTGRR